ncbi:MAG: hypothetical protein J0I44_11735 [Microbacterium sp.]|nr:hypothetical protein [Microbacterium sp.]MBN9185060.1 hypothetical protein [Microbacterium sp.]MBN9189038.1 hypothetical protein [Microbacterium sp.]MBN9192888.1 hypothetical protein [Microbacterium sp.]MBN9196727.1 hypothetical protein [Microbacterium sp.]
MFVLDNALLHVHVDPRAARLRGPQQPPRRRASSDPVRLHWSSHESPAGATVVPVIDALRHAFRCQSPRAMVATIDSALNRGLISLSELDELFALLPDRFSAVRSLVDGRAESGPETLVRLIARALGCQVELQVRFEGIGRVDLLVDGWLVVECDSREFHSDWATQRKDHARDLALAARGFPTFRVVAEDILYRPEQVLGALQGLIRSRQHV